MVLAFYTFLPNPSPYAAEWPSWYSVILISLGYLYFIYIAGPRYMKDRPPYKLKKFMLFYNIFQILTNAWIVKEHIRGGWFTKYLLCWTPDLESPDAYLLRNMIWWILLLKLFDYIETCVFVLRKKQKQISFLHVYHHVTVVIIVFLSMRYVPDIRSTFFSLLNCSVHVIMYTYYLCAAYSPETQRIIAPIKRYITIIQMIQLIIIIAYMSQVFLPSCEVREGLDQSPYLIANLFIYLLLFLNYYRKNITKTSKQKN